MWAIKALGSLVFNQSDNPTQATNLLQLTMGAFNQINSSNLKNSRECLFVEASATIRKTTTPFNYQLVISRIYEDEGDAELAAEDDDRIADEQAFLIDEILGLKLKDRPSTTGDENTAKNIRSTVLTKSQKALVWQDPGDGTGSRLFEFLIDKSINDVTIRMFETMLYQCMFERKYGINEQGMDIEEYIAQHKGTSIGSNVTPMPNKNMARLMSDESSSTPGSPSSPLAHKTPNKAAIGTPISKKTSGGLAGTTTSMNTPVSKHSVPLAAQTLLSNATSLIKILNAPLFLYDIRISQFCLMNSAVTVELMQSKPYEFHLVITEDKKPILKQLVEDRMNPVFNREHQSFVWVYIEPDTENMYSWSIKFPDSPSETAFKDMMGKCLYETLHKEAFGKVKPEEQRYLIDAYEEDTVMADAFGKLAVEDYLSEVDDEEDHEDEPRDSREDDDDDEEEKIEEDAGSSGAKGDKNSQLAVGYKYDRSFVVRGNRIGVFKHTDDNKLQFATTIDNVRDLSNNVFSPRKVMLHEQDSSMLLMKPGEAHNIYRMDLERGRIVEEWKVDDVLPVDSMLPESKFAQLTPQKTFIGINHNSIFRVDPRLSGNKRVDNETKQYATKNDFSCAITTAKGELAVASKKGDIRLFNKLNVRAKTHLPGYGNPIIGIDTTADGKWIVTTTKNYLLLIATVTEGGDSGFSKSMGAQKPTPRMLKLKPEHVAWMGVQVSFTPARFNTGEDAIEKTIVTSTGPYVITWNMKRVLKGFLNDYHIKKYADTVVADNFKYGKDDAIIVTLPENVEMISKNKLSTPQRLLTPQKARTRNSVVNSPF